MAPKKLLTPEQRTIERLYQGAMNLRDSRPAGHWPKLEETYADAYMKAFRNPQRTSKQYCEFVAMTRLYKALCKDLS